MGREKVDLMRAEAAALPQPRADDPTGALLRAPARAVPFDHAGVRDEAVDGIGQPGDE